MQLGGCAGPQLLRAISVATQSQMGALRAPVLARLLWALLVFSACEPPLLDAFSAALAALPIQVTLRTLPTTALSAKDASVPISLCSADVPIWVVPNMVGLNWGRCRRLCRLACP